jgi:hypothetical protein
MMPLIGVRCPKLNKGVPFSVCFKCENPIYPHPVLFSLINPNPREYVDGTYYVTELLLPTQQAFLQRTKDYYISPQDVVDLLIGQGVHSEIESSWKKLLSRKDENGNENPVYEHSNKLKDRYVFEQSDETEIVEGLKIRMRFDLFDRQTKILYDHKVVGAYTAEKILTDGWDDTTYDMQMNAYRVYMGIDVQKVVLEMFIKNNSRKLSDLTLGENKLVPLDVPIIPDQQVKEYFIHAITALDTAIKTGVSPPCTDADRWTRGSRYARCEGYCNVSKVCPQWNNK